MTCLDDLDVLDYIEERMAAERITDVHHHLDGCADCLSLVAQLTGGTTRAAITTKLAQLTPVPPTAQADLAEVQRGLEALVAK